MKIGRNANRKIGNEQRNMITEIGSKETLAKTSLKGN